jgi:hypothetical protein
MIGLRKDYSNHCTSILNHYHLFVPTNNHRVYQTHMGYPLSERSDPSSVSEEIEDLITDHYYLQLHHPLEGTMEVVRNRLLDD